MGLRAKQIEAQNRYVERPFSEPGVDRAPRGLQTTLEDRLIQVLEDSIQGAPEGMQPVRLAYFREFLRGSGRRLGFPSSAIAHCLTNDEFCCSSILFWVARLKRMEARHQWACNQLLQRGFTIEALPPGGEYLQQ